MFKKRIINKSNRLKRNIDELDTEIIDNKVKRKALIIKPPPELTTSEISTNLSHNGKDNATTEIKSNNNKSSLKPVSDNIKITTVTDFQPDVCKDFKETGYCGYGDTCKFLHIREESRQKKPIIKEWQNVSNRNEKREEIEHLPFKCVLCKSDYLQPVKTQCGHIFCKRCFLDRYKIKKKSSCFICDSETNGVFIPISQSELNSLINE
ncbi:unnamed protein product [Candida verbasci]|uniref:Pre-mRNA-splicing factor CWC24 n=1 Tax=Candida verbasci TaxID=1227364 RepID=A0A9W4TUW9_9ASCO|nr:unnamed protein product [Candida verbasci]